jgi:hypothetical protein
LEKDRHESEKDVIFSGATKLPPDVDQELFFDIINWWLECLSEITDMLPGAQWHVHIDDTVLEWGEEDRGRFFERSILFSSMGKGSFLYKMERVRYDKERITTQAESCNISGGMGAASKGRAAHQ